MARVKKILSLALVLVLLMSIMSVGAAAVGGEAAPASENADTGDFFAIIIALLLISAIAVAVLVACKTRFLE